MQVGGLCVSLSKGVFGCICKDGFILGGAADTGNTQVLPFQNGNTCVDDACDPDPCDVPSQPGPAFPRALVSETRECGNFHQLFRVHGSDVPDVRLL